MGSSMYGQQWRSGGNRLFPVDAEPNTDGEGTAVVHAVSVNRRVGEIRMRGFGSGAVECICVTITSGLVSITGQKRSAAKLTGPSDPNGYSSHKSESTPSISLPCRFSPIAPMMASKAIKLA